MYYSGDSQTVYRGPRGRRRIFQNIVFLSMCVYYSSKRQLILFQQKQLLRLLDLTTELTEVLGICFGLGRRNPVAETLRAPWTEKVEEPLHYSVLKVSTGTHADSRRENIVSAQTIMPILRLHCHLL